MIRRGIPEFSEKNNIIILCDSWYVKKNLVSIADEYVHKIKCYNECFKTTDAEARISFMKL